MQTDNERYIKMNDDKYLRSIKSRKQADSEKATSMVDVHPITKWLLRTTLDNLYAEEIRNFRGSLEQNIEKGVLITTGSFTPDAKEEASKPGRRLIDLMDGEELIDKLAEYNIGLKEVKLYEIDEDFFNSLDEE